jgi:hypothetical protein
LPNNVGLIGAIAAAGLAAIPAHAAESLMTHSLLDTGYGGHALTIAGDVRAQLVSHESAGINGMLQSAADALDGISKYTGRGESREAVEASNANLLTHDGAPSQSMPTALLAGTDLPEQPQYSEMTAPGVMMPSAEQLQALAGSVEPDADGARTNQVVGKVLLDAIDGGSGGLDLDAVIGALRGEDPGAVNPALEALASHGPGGFAVVDSLSHANFAIAQMHMAADQTMFHPDAAA